MTRTRMTLLAHTLSLALIGLTGQALGESRTFTTPPKAKQDTPARAPTSTVEATPSFTTSTPAKPNRSSSTGTNKISGSPFSVSTGSATAATSTSEIPASLSLGTGFQRTIELNTLPSRVSVGDPEVANVTVLAPPKGSKKGAAVLVTGLKTGSTSLMIWERGASSPKVTTIAVTGKAADTISSLSGLNLKTEGQVLKLSGTTIDVAAYQQARESLTKGSDGKAGGAELIDNTTLQTSGTVQVDVKVVEFTRSELQRLGINLQGNFKGDRFTYSITSPTASGSVSNAFALALTSGGDLTAGLNILQSDGYAKVLAEPSLIAQSGQQASFLAGGEIPIPVPSGNGSIGIEYKKFGIGLTFKPTILSNKTIAMSVSPEVSDLDFSRGTSIQGILVPAILTRRATTTVELGENQSFVIGGLISRNIIANAGQVPWLADIPILGAFFKSNSFSREDKELVIIVTPRFVKPRAENAPKIPLPGENVGMRPSSVWKQLFLPSGNEPVPGFSSK